MSKRYPNAPKRDKKVSDDDAFVAGVLEASGWAQKNQQTLIAVGVAIVLVGAVAWYMMSNAARTRDAALVELEQVTAIANTGDPEQAKAELIAFLDRFGSTPFADEARLTLATLYLETNVPAQALEILEEADAGPRDPMGPQFIQLEAKAHEAAGAFDRAEESYLRLADLANHDFQRRTALEDAARIRAEQGDYEGAAELWSGLADELESSDAQKGVYLMRAAEMRELAG